ncbi:SDR family oxidoreductase [Kushneria phosphatilytica]|uniref:SDR family oxidoreductase n=1 Tax=Kushneria phosphatilytica TaxID=657387 RepID=A0A1S1NVM8_9GAMM|nr:SDR family oxidoreductase [Kushneria phosphatilytica]OHV08936.1 NAD-dependent epimerase [Kushneria phosphatilytica]QEL09686.1 SDR family oxidoreductase [Kushneria phosphatilytica]
MAEHMKALIAGASGIIGHGAARELEAYGADVRGLARHDIEGMTTIRADLTDAEATARVIAEQAADTTHLFYAALSPDGNLSVEAERNGQMLANLLDALEAAGAPLERVVIYQGFKIYGIHLGADVPTPARESDPGHMPPNIYQAQETQLAARAERASWDYVALRPDVMVDGHVHGNPMNIALVIGVFAAISKELGIPLRFPGSERAYRVLMQFTDAGLLGRASVWAATTPNIAGQAYNITNGDVFRWERLWQDVAGHLGMETASPVPLDLPTHMADKGEVWRRLAERHDLVEPDLERLVGWGFGNFVFNTETDVISDVNKIHQAGFGETLPAGDTLLQALDDLRANRIIP